MNNFANAFRLPKTVVLENVITISFTHVIHRQKTSSNHPEPIIFSLHTYKANQKYVLTMVEAVFPISIHSEIFGAGGF